MSGMAKELKHRIKMNEQLKTLVYECRDIKYRWHTGAQWERDIEKIYRRAMKRDIDLTCPKTFTEKIQWLKLFDSTEEKTLLADKYLVRDWITEVLGDDHLIPLLDAWDSFDEIRWVELPDAFCLKMNHGSAMNYLVEDKDKMDLDKVKKQFSLWSRRPFYAGHLELQYCHIPRKILAEKYMVEMDGNLYDYKFHCFNGQPKFIQCIGDRNLKAHTGMQNNYDLQWNKLDWIFEDYPQFDYSVARPQRLDEMTEYAARLSKGFSYVRVDLYEIGDKVYFGEMTFTPASGIYPYKGSWNEKKDLELGNMIELPETKTVFIMGGGVILLLFAKTGESYSRNITEDINTSSLAMAKANGRNVA